MDVSTKRGSEMMSVFEMAPNVVSQLYRARLGLYDDLSQDACVKHSRFDAYMNLLLSCIHPTLKP